MCSIGLGARIVVMEPLIFIGASAFPEISEVVRNINTATPTYEICGILDDNNVLHGTEIEGVPVLGSLEQVSRHPHAQFVFGIGSHRTRLLRHQILRRLDLTPDRYVTLIDPRAQVYSDAVLGHGVIVHGGTVILNSARIENWAIIGWQNVVGRDVIVGEGALTGPSVTTLSGARIGSFSFVGGAGTISEAITVGPCAMVGVGTVIHRDVAAGEFVLGTPARTLSRIDVPDEILRNWENSIAAAP